MEAEADAMEAEEEVQEDVGGVGPEEGEEAVAGVDEEE